MRTFCFQDSESFVLLSKLKFQAEIKTVTNLIEIYILPHDYFFSLNMLNISFSNNFYSENIKSSKNCFLKISYFLNIVFVCWLHYTISFFIAEILPSV